MGELISVVIPSYNQANYIEENIQSILKQSYQNFEIIFIDDGSTDNTAEIVKKLATSEQAKNRIKYFYQRNSERAVSRSNGIIKAKGKYICLVDADDTWYPYKLQKQYELMQADSELILCYGAVDRIDSNSQKLPSAKRQQEGSSGYVYFDLLKRNFIPSVTPMFKAEAAKACLPQVHAFIPYEDWDFWLRMSRLGKFHFDSDILGSYRIHAAQSVQNVKAEHIAEVTLKVLENNTHLDPFDLASEHFLHLANRKQGLGTGEFLQNKFSSLELNKAQLSTEDSIKKIDEFIEDRDGQTALKIKAEKNELIAELNKIRVRLFRREINSAYSLAYLRIAYWYIVADDVAKARLSLRKAIEYNKLRGSDIRLTALYVASFIRSLPLLGDMTKKLLASYH